MFWIGGGDKIDEHSTLGLWQRRGRLKSRWLTIDVDDG
jgi:hypothetical protein